MFKNCFKFLILVLNIDNYLQKELDDFFFNVVNCIY